MIIPLQAIKGQLRTKSKFYVLPDPLYRLANSKNEMYRVAQNLEIPVAKGVFVACENDALMALDSLRGPWVFKPDYSYSAGAFESRNTVHKAFSRDGAVEQIPGFLSKGQFQIQENFVGVGTGVELLCDRGEPLLAFQHIRVHEPHHGGGSSYRRGSDIHPGMLEAAQKLMARLQYTGVAMVEFKWNQASGRWIFIELNARFWGSLPLALASGADFPRALVELLMFGKRSFAYSIRNDLYARNIHVDFNWMISNIGADKTNPILSTLPWRIVLGEFWNIFRGKERWDTFAPDDPWPLFGEIAGLLKEKTRSAILRIVCSAPYLTASRSSRRLRLKHKLNLAKRIGFVCHGNICRSPFAESWAQKKFTGIIFFSAGFHDVDGRPAPDNAVAAAETFRIDLAKHRSIHLSAEAARSADVLFVFDRRNFRNMHLRFPEAIDKTFLLSDLSAAARLEIDDPWDLELGMFIDTYRIIQASIDAMPGC